MQMKTFKFIFFSKRMHLKSVITSTKEINAFIIKDNIHYKKIKLNFNKIFIVIIYYIIGGLTVFPCTI